MTWDTKLKFAVILAIFGATLGIFAKFPNTHAFDIEVSHFLQTIQSNWFVSFNYLMSLVEFGIVFIVLPLFIYLQRKGKEKEAYFILIAGLAWFLMRALKASFAVPCPTASEVKLLFPFHGLENVIRPNINSVRYLDPDVCYPSGHVFDYISIWGMLYFLRRRIWENKKIQEIIKYLSISLISFIGIARISLGAHFLTDVLGGYLFGFSWLLILTWIYQHRDIKTNESGPRGRRKSFSEMDQ